MRIPGFGKILEKTDTQDFSLESSNQVDRSADNLIISGKVSLNSFEEFEEIAFQNYATNNNLQIYAHDRYRELITNSDKLHSDVVNYFAESYSFSQIADILVDSKLSDRSIFVTNEKYKGMLRNSVGNEDGIITIYE